MFVGDSVAQMEAAEACHWTTAVAEACHRWTTAAAVTHCWVALGCPCPAAPP